MLENTLKSSSTSIPAADKYPHIIRLSLFIGEGILLSMIIGSLKTTKVELARKLGGNLRLVKSCAGEGSQFLITALTKTPEKICNSEEVEVSMENAQIVKTNFRASLGGKKVLVVDDSADNQLLMSCFLTPYGIDVEFASDGEEGVSKALANPHDVVLMDIQMPLMDGYEALEFLRQKGYAGNVVALTAHSMIEEQSRCLESGFNGFLSKPISRETLLHAIANLTVEENS